MKDRFKGNYIKIITKLVDTSKFPAILCSINSNAKNLFQFPKIVHCNKLFERTFNRRCADIVGKDFDSIINFDFPENAYIKFIKKIKGFEKITVKAKVNLNQESRCFAITFHPLVFMSTYDKKYCLIDYIPIRDMRENPENIYDVLENVNNNFKTVSAPPPKETSESVNRILHNENFLKKTYEEIEKSENIRKTLDKIAQLIAEYLKANRVIINVFDLKNSIRYFSEYSDKNLLKLSDNNEDRVKYIDFIDKLIKTKRKFDHNKLKVLFIREKDDNSKIGDIKEILKKLKIKSQMIIEDEVQNNIFVRICIHQCYSDKEWLKDEVDLINRIIERLSLVIEKNINNSKLQTANKQLKAKAIALENSLKKERETRKIQTEFIAMVSHQFRTPLQIIESARGILKRRIDRFTGLSQEDRDLVKPLIGKIKNAVSRMNTLINKTLDLSNIETNNDITYYPAFISLKKIINDCVDRMTPNNNNVIIKKSLTNLPEVFFGDEKMLEHVFSNIIENAVKYSNKDGIVEIFTERNHDNFVISIKDYGIGIPNGDKENIFKKFARAKNVQTINGTGIGLFLAKRFVEKHNGEIKVESEENKGTVFHLVFPFNKNKQVI